MPIVINNIKRIEMDKKIKIKKAFYQLLFWRTSYHFPNDPPSTVPIAT